MGVDLYVCDLCGECMTSCDFNIELSDYEVGNDKKNDEVFGYTLDDKERNDYDKVKQAFDDVHEYACGPLWCGCSENNWVKLNVDKKAKEQEKAKDNKIKTLKKRVADLEAELELQTKTIKPPKKEKKPRGPPQYKRITIQQYAEYQTLMKKN